MQDFCLHILAVADYDIIIRDKISIRIDAFVDALPGGLGVHHKRRNMTI